ncbi:lipopolysaccharide heptosyltransferase II [Planctomycetota bacterium]|nr:lipopolysaccharide heptosyltransferase II [Planctomycetota bacterium]
MAFGEMGYSAAMLEDQPKARNVVVRAPNALGDLIMATPAFARLAAHFGPEHLSLVCLPPALPVLEGQSWFKEIIPFDRKGEHKGLMGGHRFAAELRKHQFDLGVILPNSFGSAWQFFLGRVKRRVGYYKEGRRVILHSGIERDHDSSGKFIPKYTGQYFMDLLDHMGVPETPLAPSLPITEVQREAAAKFLSDKQMGNKPLVILAPGGAFGPSKLWPLDRYAKVVDALHDDGFEILISHAPNELTQAEGVLSASKNTYPTSGGLNLGTLKAVYDHAKLVLTNDTGPRHFGVALGKPVVCVMGPNDPRYTAIPDIEQGEVIREAVDCSPYSWPCQMKECPIDHRCMSAITVERVLASCRKILAG